jgi:hypothetical protein
MVSDRDAENSREGGVGLRLRPRQAVRCPFRERKFVFTGQGGGYTPAVFHQQPGKFTRH